MELHCIESSVFSIAFNERFQLRCFWLPAKQSELCVRIVPSLNATHAWKLTTFRHLNWELYTGRWGWMGRSRRKNTNKSNGWLNILLQSIWFGPTSNNSLLSRSAFRIHNWDQHQIKLHHTMPTEQMDSSWRDQTHREKQIFTHQHATFRMILSAVKKKRYHVLIGHCSPY